MPGYYTVKEIAELVRPNWIESVKHQNKQVVIQTATDKLTARKCDNCKSGIHKSPTTAPRIKIKAF